MKKLFTSILCLTIFTSMAHATIYYVNPSAGSDSNDGLTWNTSLSTIAAATGLATANPGVDDVYIKGENFFFDAPLAVGNSQENYYGSFKGDETSPAQRPHIDIDGNGVAEPWEFEFPTILKFETNTNALTLPNQDIQFDGFTITHIGTHETAHMRTVTLGNTLARFWNNTIKDCNLSMPILASSSNSRSVIMKSFGSIKNCLFENNTILATRAVTNGAFQLIEVNGSGSAPSLTPPGTKFTNNVIRNNKVTADFSASTVGTVNVRGMILNIDPSATPDTYTTVSNCLIHNNEIEMITNASFPTTSASLVCINNTASGKDSVINNTIANNKGINVKTAGLSMIIATTSENVVLNNALWNNQVGDVQNNIIIAGGIANLSAVSSFKSNINSGGVSGLEENGTNIVNNLSDLSSGNTGANAPLFKNPSSAIGITTDFSAETSNWRINLGSYLIGKGVATTSLKDKDGMPFLSPRSVGAFEYYLNSGVQGQKNTNEFVFASNGALFSKVEGRIQVIGIDGKTMKNEIVAAGQSLRLPSGIYIVSLTTDQESYISKVVL
ncbi:MAG TPA: hypothetical protein DEH15_13990 [Marinilabiliales bacterium]|nr:hypothetical protein [Marinilabiliales bacterium]